MTSIGLAPVLVSVFAAVLLTALLVVSWQFEYDKGRQVIGRVDPYRPRQSDDTRGWMPAPAVRAVTRVLRSSDTEHKLAARLLAAGIRRKPGEWVLIGICASVALAILLAALTGNVPVGILLGAVAGWLGTRQALNLLIRRRRTAFTNQLPEVLELVAGSLQSGLTLGRALDSVVRHGLQPAGAEFALALAETRLGTDLEKALDGVATRMDSTDMAWTVMAIDIQRAVGGNLVEVLRNVVTTMRERGYLRRHVQALTAEGRMSAYILVALPIVLGGWLFYSSPAYMRPLYTTTMGVIVLSASVALVVAGWLWMRKLVKPEI